VAATIFYESDSDLDIITGRKVAVLGYGSQGHAHALNLKDSGADVRVGLRPGSKSRADAEAAGLTVMDTNDAAEWGDVIVVLLPDTHQQDMWEDGVKDAMKAGDALVFGHGFNVHFGYIEPPADIDVFLCAPKSPGHMVRRTYETGQGTPGLIAIHQDATGNALELAKSYGMGIGVARAGILQTTFKEETETDLFGEQAVLCGGVTELMQAGFDTLVEAGYQPEIAYFECVHEMKLIVDLIYEGGFEKMRHSVSNTAEYGDYRTGKRIVTEETRAEMRQVLREIQTGRFAHEFLLENQVGQPRLKTERAASDRSQVAEVGRRLRKMMSFIEK
jgi:ketol-acid reductoisomerase